MVSYIMNDTDQEFVDNAKKLILAFSSLIMSIKRLHRLYRGLISLKSFLRLHISLLWWVLKDGWYVFFLVSHPIFSNWTGRKTHQPSLSRHVDPFKKAIYEVIEKEFKRLRGYLLFPSDSPVCSNIIMTSKATPSYVRLCGVSCYA